MNWHSVDLFGSGTFCPSNLEAYIVVVLQAQAADVKSLPCDFAIIEC